MLRRTLLAIGAIALVLAAALLLFRAPFPLVMWLTMLGGVLVGGILLERGRYKPAAPDRPGPDWVATDERFIDPQSGEEVTVFYRPATGERRYVAR
jgi:hypothetical protein